MSILSSTSHNTPQQMAGLSWEQHPAPTLLELQVKDCEDFTISWLNACLAINPW